ncbi:hypothetical protein GCM10010174_03590 [Kutzneria viridogrisea]
MAIDMQPGEFTRIAGCHALKERCGTRTTVTKVTIGVLNYRRSGRWHGGFDFGPLRQACAPLAGLPQRSSRSAQAASGVRTRVRPG